LLALFLVPLTIVVWGFWALLYGKPRWIGLVIFALLIGFFTLYIPNFRGDIGIAGFTPRFWARSVAFVEPPSTNARADLKTTTDQDFPQFLGPNRDTRVDSVQLAESWDETKPELLWKIDVGEAWSGFVVVNGFAITQEQRGAEECVTCYEVETGKPVWVNSASRRLEDQFAMGKVGPRATPTVNEGRVYVTSGTGVLDCLNGSNGKLAWTADVPTLVNIKQNFLKNSMGLLYSTENSPLAWGRSTSPLIVDDLVIVPAGGPAPVEGVETPTPVTLIAFDKTTGEEKWRGGSRNVSYSSPTLATIGGQPQILLVSEEHAVGHDPLTGKELWNHEWFGISSAQANCSQVTVVDENRLLLTKGYNQGGEVIEVSKSGDAWQVKSLDKNPRDLKTKLTSPVVYDGYAYALSAGYLECVSIDGLERKWIQRGGFGNGQLLLVGDKLLVHSETGTLTLVAAEPQEYKELGSIPTIKGICWNTLCLYGDLLLVRSEIEAACYRLPTVTQ
jgi:outer membrane protein assembly factor BamB